MGDSVRFKKKMENERVFEFLTRLNRELDDVRSRVLSRQPLPSIREVFSEVRREENKRKVMLDLSFGPEGSALLTHGPHGPHGPLTVARRGPHAGSSGPHPARSSGPSPRQSKRTYCEYCKKLGHTKDTCWALHGKPPQIGSPDSPIKLIVIRPPPKPRQTKLPQKFVSQLLVWG